MNKGKPVHFYTYDRPNHAACGHWNPAKTTTDWKAVECQKCMHSARFRRFVASTVDLQDHRLNGA